MSCCARGLCPSGNRKEEYSVKDISVQVGNLTISQRGGSFSIQQLWSESSRGPQSFNANFEDVKEAIIAFVSLVIEQEKE